jgi:hypothetical protein
VRKRGGRVHQFKDGEVEVTVTDSYNRDRDAYDTDVIVKPLGHGWGGQHQHVIIDESGRILMNEWRDKR